MLFTTYTRLRSARSANWYGFYSGNKAILVSSPSSFDDSWLTDSRSILVMTKSMSRIPAVESQRIDEIANKVTAAKTALEICVNRLEHERLARIDETSNSTLSEARVTRQTIHGHHDIMMRALDDIAARQNQSRLQDGKELRDILKECFREVLASTMQTDLYRLVEETEYCQSKSQRTPLTHEVG